MVCELGLCGFGLLGSDASSIHKPQVCISSRHTWDSGPKLHEPRTKHAWATRGPYQMPVAWVADPPLWTPGAAISSRPSPPTAVPLHAPDEVNKTPYLSQSEASHPLQLPKRPKQHPTRSLKRLQPPWFMPLSPWSKPAPDSEVQSPAHLKPGSRMAIISRRLRKNIIPRLATKERPGRAIRP